MFLRDFIALWNNSLLYFNCILFIFLFFFNFFFELILFSVVGIVYGEHLQNSTWKQEELARRCRREIDPMLKLEISLCNNQILICLVGQRKWSFTWMQLFFFISLAPLVGPWIVGVSLEVLGHVHRVWQVCHSPQDRGPWFGGFADYSGQSQVFFERGESFSDFPGSPTPWPSWMFMGSWAFPLLVVAGPVQFGKLAGPMIALKAP